jgi:hypothetical protein
MTIWRENCASRFEANKTVNDVGDLETKSQKPMHHEEIELNFDASCQHILVLESEILWEAI